MDEDKKVVQFVPRITTEPEEPTVFECPDCLSQEFTLHTIGWVQCVNCEGFMTNIAVGWLDYD